MSRKRKIATFAAYGGGGLGVLGALGGAALFGILIGETKLARHRIPNAQTAPPVSHDTTWAAVGVRVDATPIRIAMLGDSSAAGYGVHRDRDTPAAQLAIAISDVARRPVHVTNVAVVGAQSHTLRAQIDELGADLPELAVIMIGANDVTHRIKPAESVRHLEAAVLRLRRHHVEVVVGTCPDLGTIRPLAQPLRAYARRLSRTLAAAQTVAVVGAGGRTVSLGDLLGPLFASSRDMFSDDQFHPSAAGYAAAADALLPSALDELGLGTRARSASPFTTRLPKPVAKAAAQAAARPGTEVAATDWHGESAGRRGPWAQLRRRRPRKPVIASPEMAIPVIEPVTATTGR
ncbi:MAG: GDSL family lipase [Pseudonocardiales bacterium]|nr:MAG: GDSL family lipase [Pseudonocardiales bacterium]